MNQEMIDTMIKIYGDDIDCIGEQLMSKREWEIFKNYRCALCYTRVAKTNKVSITRIAQIMNKIVRKLMHPAKMKKIMEVKNVLGKLDEANKINMYINCRLMVMEIEQDYYNFIINMSDKELKEFFSK